VTTLERLAFEAGVVAAASSYYDDPARGRTALEDGWSTVRDNPGLLPTEPAKRNQVYQSLAVLLLARYNESQEAGDELASWLANHLPDQVPSAKQLPPKLSVRAAEALRRSHGRKGTLTATAPKDCDNASLLLDGRKLGTVPMLDVPVHTGRHAVWFECGGKASWVRLLQVEDSATLEGPRIDHEAAFLVAAGHLQWSDNVLAAEAIAPARRLLPALGVDAVALIPAESEGEALVITAGDVIALPLPSGVTALTVTQNELWSRPWTMSAKWVATGFTFAALGVGMMAHARHDREIDTMRYGTVDARGEADRWQKVAIGGYAVGATAAVSAILLFILDGRDEPFIDPLFSVNGTP